MTVNDIFKRVRVLLDEWTDDGVEIPEADVIDLQEKVILLSDMAQRELFAVNRNYKTFEYTHKPVENLLEEAFKEYEFIGEDFYLPNTNGVSNARSYSLEVNDEGTIEIQEYESGSWNTLDTITHANESFTTYKGLITKTTDTNKIRIKFSGTTYYKVKNIALFKEPFSADRIPTYKPYFKVDMPSDFRRLKDIIKEEIDKERSYTKFRNYYWEGLNDLYVSWFFDGDIRVIYNGVPVELTSINDTLEVDDITAQAIIYFVASKVAPYENESLVNFYEDKYNSIKYELRIESSQPEDEVEDIYGIL